MIYIVSHWPLSTTLDEIKNVTDHDHSTVDGNLRVLLEYHTQAEIAADRTNMDDIHKTMSIFPN